MGVRGSAKRLYEYKNKMLDLTQISKLCGIPAKTIQSRLHNRWDLIKATTTPLKKSRLYEYKNKKYTLVGLSIITNIHYKTLDKRLQNGWAVEEAVETPVHPQYKLATALYSYKGEEMGVCQLINYASDKYLSIQNLEYRLHNGWAVEEALSSPVGSKNLEKLPSAEVIKQQCKKDAKLVTPNTYGCGHYSKATDVVLESMSEDRKEVNIY